MAGSSPEVMAQTMIDNMPAKTGKSLDQWLSILAKTKLAKHGETVKHLKTEYGVTHGFASLIAHRHIAGNDTGNDPAELVATQYKGPKANLLPVYEALVKMVEAFGSDVEISPKKTYVSLRRNKQFALIKPASKDRVDLGINLKGQKAGKRLEAAGSFGGMVSHRVRLCRKRDVNAELEGWLRKAYDVA